MNTIDWVILTVILVSTLISIWRGAVRESISLATWGLAALIAFKFNNLLVPFYSAFTANESLQLAGSFLTLVILIVVLGTIVGITLSKAISKIGLGPLDRTLGMGFGCLRGVLIISVIIIFAKSTELPAQPEWKQSKLLPQFDVVVNYINQWIKSQGYEPFGSQSKSLE